MKTGLVNLNNLFEDPKPKNDNNNQNNAFGNFSNNNYNQRDPFDDDDF